MISVCRNFNLCLDFAAVQIAEVCAKNERSNHAINSKNPNPNQQIGFHRIPMHSFSLSQLDQFL